MAEITAQAVNELRKRTQAGMMECKKALAETKGDIDKAADILRARGKLIMEKKADRATNEGGVFSYIHPGAKLGVMLELACETDFVARNEIFQELGKDLAMQVAATSPRYTTREQVPQEELDKEMQLHRTEAIASGKPEAVADKIAQGRMDKRFAEFVLLEQPFVKADKQTVRERIAEAVSKLGEKIEVRRFTRFQVGA